MRHILTVPLKECRNKRRMDKKKAKLTETTLITSIKPGLTNTANATTTTQKQNDYKVEQSSFALIALF